MIEACQQVIARHSRFSTLLARTVRAGVVAQELHSDLQRDDPARPMLGFILMVDPFRLDNGATRFIPGSHRWREVPGDALADCRAAHPDEALAVGPAGSLVMFDASIWHGHTANTSAFDRRSIQGYFRAYVASGNRIINSN